MDTDILYLELVRKDLVDAGGRETARRSRPSTVLLEPRSQKLVAIASAMIVVAGVIGWVVTAGGISEDQAGDGAPAAGSTGATGATGGAEVPGLGYQGSDDSLVSAPPADTPVPGSANVTADPNAISRVIREGRLGLVIPPDSFDDRFAQAVELASANGGFVATSTTHERSGSLTIRVPAASFDETLGGLRALGDVDVQRITGQDVTAEYVDLGARLRIEKSRREVLLRLMDQAVSIEQTIRVQNALDDTQLRIEQLQGSLRLLDDRVALATVEVSLREEGGQAVQDIETASLPNAFERSVAGFVGVIAAIVVGIGYLIPLAMIGLAVWFVVSRVRRRHSA